MISFLLYNHPYGVLNPKKYSVHHMSTRRSRRKQFGPAKEIDQRAWKTARDKSNSECVKKNTWGILGAYPK